MKMKQSIQLFEDMALRLKDAVKSKDHNVLITAAETVEADLKELAEDLRSVFKIYFIVKNERIVAIKSSEAALVSKELKLEKHKVEGVTIYTDYDKAFEDAKEVKDSYIIAVGIDGKLSQQKLEIDDAPEGQVTIEEVNELPYSVGGIIEGQDHAENVVKLGSESEVIDWLLQETPRLKEKFSAVEYFTTDDRTEIPIERLSEFIEEFNSDPS